MPRNKMKANNKLYMELDLIGRYTYWVSCQEIIVNWHTNWVLCLDKTYWYANRVPIIKG